MEKLSGVPLTLTVPLWARAAETDHANPIISDEMAKELISKIDVDLSHLTGNNWRAQLSIALRTKILNELVGDFVKRHPDGVLVNLGCGLDNRFHRVDNGRISWYELDLPQTIDLRRQFFQESDRYHFIASSVFDDQWLQMIPKDRPLMLIAEGLFPYFESQQLRPLFAKLIETFPGAEMLFEQIGTAILKYQDKIPEIKNIAGATLKWVEKDSRVLEAWHPKLRFVGETNINDLPTQGRGGFLWHFVKCFSFLKPVMYNRIVAVKFTE